MIVAVCVEGVLLALALLFVLGLLRSHADILRRLHALEGSGATASEPGVGPDPRAARVGANPGVTVPATLAGVTPGGDAVAIGLGAGAPRTLLAFLSSGCAVCGPMWDALRERSPVPAATRLVVVTKGPERESPARIAGIAPPRGMSGDGRRVDVVMSSDAFDALEVPVTPHFLLVEGGRLLGRGSATSWSQILGLLGDAEADGGSGLAARPAGTSERAARAEAALADAGIGADHPSLYPTRVS